jgi:hypothetical protein
MHTWLVSGSHGGGLSRNLSPLLLSSSTALDWTEIGTKLSLQNEITEIIGINTQILCGTAPVDSACVAQRMSWAARRETTRVEDMAYSLMGLFEVNMPMLYGEGNKAFERLQLEIIKNSNDQSIFAWDGLPASLPEVKSSVAFDKVLSIRIDY